MPIVPNPIIVPMEVETQNAAVNMDVANDQPTVPFQPTTYLRPMPNITIGDVESGAEAEATMTGTADNPVLNLVLPKGDKGDKGDKGEKGDKGDKGDDGETGIVVYYCSVPAFSELPVQVTLSNGKTVNDVLIDARSGKSVVLKLNWLAEDEQLNLVFHLSGGFDTPLDDPPGASYCFTCKITDFVIMLDEENLTMRASNVENTQNKVTTLTAAQTDKQYPSAKCVYDALQGKQNTLTFDSAPTQGGDNPVTSGGIYTALQGKADTGAIPTKTSNLQNDGSDGTSTYVEADELASVATSGNFSDLSGTPSYTATDLGASKTITALSQSDGTIDATASDIQIRPVQVKVGSSGDEAQVENNDVLAIFDSNDLEKLKYSNLQFDTNNATDFLRKDGTFATPAYPVGIPSGGNAGQILKKTSATAYDVNWADQTQYYPSGYSTTAADKQTKQIACSAWTATAKSYLHILLTHANTYAGKIYFTVNAVNTYEVWINGEVSSATNYSLPAGSYILFFDGSAYQVRTDGLIPASITGTAAKIPFGELDSTSTSTVMKATVPGITELKDGTTMMLYNGVVTSASGFTLNINGLGGKPCYSNMTLGNPVTPTNPTRDTTIFNINYAFLFVYSETIISGGAWIGYRGYDANTNTIGYQLRTNSSTMKTADKFYRYRLLFTSADGTMWIPANTSTSTNATAARTPTTRAIDPFGEIVWYGTTTAIEANAAVTAAQLWQEYAGSYSAIGYSFNNTGAAQTMTANLPIYIKCTPQADGSAIIDPTTPYTQTLPSTDDGKIYIYLGRAYNATNFEITMNHPVYYHDGTGIRLWNGVRNIPQAPTVDGTYVLKCTVNNGAVTYNWVLE